MIPKTPSYLQMPLQHDMMRSTISFDCRTLTRVLFEAKLQSRVMRCPTAALSFMTINLRQGLPLETQTTLLLSPECNQNVIA